LLRLTRSAIHLPHLHRVIMQQHGENKIEKLTWSWKLGLKCGS
jgi:hypothetical protein